MWYTRRHENTHFYPSTQRGRTAADTGRIAFVRCFCLASVPDSVGFGTRGTRPRYRPCVGLRRPNRAQRAPRLQCTRPGRLAGSILAPASLTNGLHRRKGRTPQRAVASQPTRVRPRAQHLDVGTGGPGQLRAGHHLRTGLRRERASRPQAAQNQLEACQALDHQSRPAVSAKKKARDRLIAWASQQANWAIGFLDEVWWSRFALPRMHAWQDGEHPVRLVEQSWQKDDPDPKALACYGVLWQEGSPQEPIREQMWLRFVSVRPVSAITTQFLDWCCQRLQKLGKGNWLLIWDNASWHKSQAVRGWIREHNQQVKQAGKGVRIPPFQLPTQSPWLNPIEPKWVHGKRNVGEYDGLLTAEQLAKRVCAYFGCSHEPHLSIPEKVA